jgi:hypothetical protein
MLRELRCLSLREGFRVRQPTAMAAECPSNLTMTDTYTFSEPIDPGSILAGWTGAATNVVFRFVNGPQTDSFVVYNATNTAQLPLGSVDTGKKYVTQNITFGATGTPSTMVVSGSTITITLGTASGNTSTANGNVNMKWTPSVLATDRAGNPTTLTNVTETGTGDLDF